jgi:hypothetical protein
MSDRPTSEMVVGTATVNGRELEIVRLTWRDSPGLSFDVYDRYTGQCFTEDGSLDDPPTEEQLTAIVKQAEDEGRFQGAAGRNDADIIDEIGGS